MGRRNRGTIDFKPAPKTSVFRAPPASLIKPRGNSMPFSSRSADVVEDWGVRITAEEQHNGGTLPAYEQIDAPQSLGFTNNAGTFDNGTLPASNQPNAPPSEDLMHSATLFLDDVFSRLLSQDAFKLAESFSVKSMDVDLSPGEAMETEDDFIPPCVDMDTDIDIDFGYFGVPPFDVSHTSVPMDIAGGETYSPMAIDEFFTSPFVLPSLPAFSEDPITPPNVGSAARWDLNAGLALVRREIIASVDQTIQRLSAASSPSPVDGLLVRAQRTPEVAQPSKEDTLLPSAFITTSSRSSPDQPPHVHCDIDVVAVGINDLDISDDLALVLRTPPKPAKENDSVKELDSVKEVQQLNESPPSTVKLITAPNAYREPEASELLSPCTVSDVSSPQLRSLDSVDLFDLDHIAPLHSTPTYDGPCEHNTKGAWSGIGELNEAYEKIAICNLPEGDKFMNSENTLADLDATSDEQVEISANSSEGLLCEVGEGGQPKTKLIAEYVVRAVKLRTDRTIERKERQGERRARKQDRRRLSSPRVNTPSLTDDAVPQTSPRRRVAKDISKTDAFISNANLGAARMPRFPNPRLASPYRLGRRSPSKGIRPISPEVADDDDDDVTATTLGAISDPSSTAETLEENDIRYNKADFLPSSNVESTTPPTVQLSQVPYPSIVKEVVHDTNSVSRSSTTPGPEAVYPANEPTAKEVAQRGKSITQRTQPSTTPSVEPHSSLSSSNVNSDGTKTIRNTTVPSSTPLSVVDQNIQPTRKAPSLVNSSIANESTPMKPKVSRWNGVPLPRARFGKASPAEAAAKENVQVVDQTTTASISSSSSATMETTPAKTPLNEERTDVTPPPTNSSTPPLPAKRPIKIMPSKQPKTASTAQPSSAPHIVKPVDVATLEPPTVYMPHTHKIMKEKGLRITAPRDPFLRPPRSRPDSDFFKPQEKYTPRPASSYPRLYPSSRKSKTVEGDATLSCSESKASLSGSVKAQSSKDSDLLSSKSRTPEFVISQAARIRVLPGAIPSSEYHAPEDDDILALQPVAQTMTQQSWLGRVVGRIFSW